MKAFAFLAVILLFAAVAPAALAQTVSHEAEQVKAGIFGANFGGGNFTFNNSMFVVDKLGINTTNPAATFNLVSSGIAGGTFFYDVYSDTQGPIFTGRRARGTSGSPTAVQTNDVLSAYGGRGYGATGFPTGQGNRGALVVVAAETWTDTAQGAFLRFSTTQNGTTAFSEKVRITDTGNVGIGTTSPSQKLTVVGNVNITGNLTVGGSMPAGSVVQFKYHQRGDLVNCVTAFPCDDTIPQITEGDEVLTVTITPTNANNIINIKVSLFFSGYYSPSGIGLFKVGQNDSLAAAIFDYGINSELMTGTLDYSMVAGTTSPITFKVRAGINGGSYFYLNGVGPGTGTRKLGGVGSSSMTVTEIAA